MVSVDEAYAKWLRYSGYTKPKLSFDAYHKIVQQLTPQQLKQLVSKIKKRQARELTRIRRMRRK